MNDNDDKLGNFLREHRPVPPPGSADAFARVQLAARRGRQNRLRVAALVPVAAVLVCAIWLGRPDNTERIANARLLNESIGLSFLEEEGSDDVEGYITALAD